MQCILTKPCEKCDGLRAKGGSDFLGFDPQNLRRVSYTGQTVSDRNDDPIRVCS
ncbi:hypothetical protein RchiOBHm_Chr2g0105791 [Rosa chinensis]|uniref:Uncharacterized protein n=1 Tax=Rosa chinensis TaxID=74649 RepID=A0A2P6RNJ4_ROSCH|nr:hypothetical protein RchiOBHm_Chr2g0105791 [Rosa chinensis]